MSRPGITFCFGRSGNAHGFAWRTVLDVTWAELFTRMCLTYSFGRYMGRVVHKDVSDEQFWTLHGQSCSQGCVWRTVLDVTWAELFTRMCLTNSFGRYMGRVVHKDVSDLQFWTLHGQSCSQGCVWLTVLDVTWAELFTRMCLTYSFGRYMGRVVHKDVSDLQFWTLHGQSCSQGCVWLTVLDVTWAELFTRMCLTYSFGRYMGRVVHKDVSDLQFWMLHGQSCSQGCVWLTVLDVTWAELFTRMCLTYWAVSAGYSSRGSTALEPWSLVGCSSRLSLTRLLPVWNWKVLSAGNTRPWKVPPFKPGVGQMLLSVLFSGQELCLRLCNLIIMVTLI